MKTLLFLIVVHLALSIQGQNLILNPSFEDFYPCPSSPSTLKNSIQIADWFSPTKGTPDVFSPCSESSEMSVPNNILGFAEAYHGDSYVGLILARPWESKHQYYREYLETQLAETLEANKTYQLSFAYRPAQHSRYEIQKISIAFSSEKLEFPDGDILGKFPFIESIPTENVSVDDKGWSKASVIIKAKGDENFLLVGDLALPNKENYRQRGFTMERSSRGCYYLFDDFSLQMIPQTTFTLDSIFSLPLLHFATNSSTINASHLIALQGLAIFLNENKEHRLKIMGHTDKVGNDDYNQKLSEERALAVKEELIGMGVAQDRIEVVGYGKKRLISGKDAKNRRVEFLIESGD